MIVQGDYARRRDAAPRRRGQFVDGANCAQPGRLAEHRFANRKRCSRHFVRHRYREEVRRARRLARPGVGHFRRRDQGSRRDQRDL